MMRRCFAACDVLVGHQKFNLLRRRRKNMDAGAGLPSNRDQPLLCIEAQRFRHARHGRGRIAINTQRHALAQAEFVLGVNPARRCVLQDRGDTVIVLDQQVSGG